MDLLDLFVKVGYDDSAVDSGIAGTSKKGSKLASALGKGFGVVTKAVGVISTGLVTLGTLGVKYNAQMEQYQTSFEVMLGSEQEAIALTEELKQKAASTPFEMTDLANVTQLLLNYGITQDEVIDKMGMLGDISQGNADKLNSIALAYGQMSSLGRVTLQDVKQMIGAGFNPLQEISERTGESMESLYDRISKGTLAVDEITEAMQYSTSEGGKYFQSMEKQSLTFNGLLSTLKDNATSALGAVTDGLSEIAKDTVLPTLIGYVDRLSTAFEDGGFEGLFTELGSVLGEAISSVAEAAPAVVDGALAMLDAFARAIIDNLPVIVPAAVSIVSSIFMFMVENLPLLLEAGFEILATLASSISEQLPSLIPTIVEIIMTIVEMLIENVPLLLDGAIALLEGLANGIIESLPILVARIPELIIALVNAIAENLPMIIMAAVQIIIALVTGLVQAIPQLIAAIPQIVMAIVQAFAALAPQLWEVGKGLITGIWEGISKACTWLWGKISTFAKNVISKIKGAFGIHSPSKVMQTDVGAQIARGIGIGITDNTGDVTGAVESLSDAVSDAAAGSTDAGREVMRQMVQGMLLELKALMSKIVIFVDTYIIKPMMSTAPTFFTAGSDLAFQWCVGMISRQGEIEGDARYLAELANSTFRSYLDLGIGGSGGYGSGGSTGTASGSATNLGATGTGSSIAGLTVNFYDKVSSQAQTAKLVAATVEEALYSHA